MHKPTRIAATFCSTRAILPRRLRILSAQSLWIRARRRSTAVVARCVRKLEILMAAWPTAIRRSVLNLVCRGPLIVAGRHCMRREISSAPLLRLRKRLNWTPIWLKRTVILARSCCAWARTRRPKKLLGNASGLILQRKPNWRDSGGRREIPQENSIFLSKFGFLRYYPREVAAPVGLDASPT